MSTTGSTHVKGAIVLHTLGGPRHGPPALVARGSEVRLTSHLRALGLTGPVEVVCLYPEALK